MQATNYASLELGASVVDSSGEASLVASSVKNILVDSNERVWIAGEPPQHVTIRLPAHPPIRYLGWHVANDYVTNPRIVEFAAGSSPNAVREVVKCVALPGPGFQLWELSVPIPTHESYLRMSIVACFGAGNAYLNRVYAFSEDPGPGFQRAAPYATASAPSGRIAGAHSTTLSRALNGSRAGDAASPSFTVSTLLRDLDEDIRQLHPLRNISPQKTKVIHAPNMSSFIEERDFDDTVESSRASPARQPPTAMRESDWNSALNRRLMSLEQSLATVVRSLEEQRRDIDFLRRSVSSSKQQDNISRSAFPDEALRNYVEDVLAPKISKHSKRIEQHVIERLDAQLHAHIEQISDTVDDRVKRYLHHVAIDMEHPFHHHFLHAFQNNNKKYEALTYSRDDKHPKSTRRADFSQL